MADHLIVPIHFEVLDKCFAHFPSASGKTPIAADDVQTLGLVLLSSSNLSIHVLVRQESDTTPMAFICSITSFCVYVAILFQNLDPLAMVFVQCVTVVKTHSAVNC